MFGSEGEACGDPGRATPEVVTLHAPAKVNLDLRVLGRRADGYHEIDTLMQTVSLCDTLTVESSDDERMSLRMTGRVEGVEAGGSNLALKAAELLRAEAGGRGAVIGLEKRIPVGAGLGGGSSDAAATLIALCRLWDLELSEERLLGLSADLGSDVPFFVRGGTARCTGRGEIVRSVAARGEAHFVLVFSAPVSTAKVYAGLDSDGIDTSLGAGLCGNIPGTENGGLDLSQIRLRPVHNSLERAALDVRPSLEDVRCALVDMGADQVAMSGSGSCFYGVVASADRAEDMAAELRKRGMEAAAARSIGPRSF